MRQGRIASTENGTRRSVSIATPKAARGTECSDETGIRPPWELKRAVSPHFRDSSVMNKMDCFVACPWLPPVLTKVCRQPTSRRPDLVYLKEMPAKLGGLHFVHCLFFIERPVLGGRRVVI